MQHPDGIRVAAEHECLDFGCHARYVDTAGIAAFMEQVPGKARIVAVEFCLFFVPCFGYAAEKGIVRMQDGWAGHAAPVALGQEPCPRVFVGEVERHQTDEALQDGAHAEFAHAGQYLLLEFDSRLHVCFRDGAADALAVAHQPPCGVGRPGGEGAGFVTRVAEPLEDAEPYFFRADDGKGVSTP